MLPVRPNSRCCSPLDEAGGELAQKHANVAAAPSGDASGPGMGAGADECGSEHGLGRRTGEPGTVGSPPQTDRNTRFFETASGVLSYVQLAPLLAERVLACEDEIVDLQVRKLHCIWHHKRRSVGPHLSARSECSRGSDGRNSRNWRWPNARAESSSMWILSKGCMLIRQGRDVTGCPITSNGLSLH